MAPNWHGSYCCCPSLSSRGHSGTLKAWQRRSGCGMMIGQIDGGWSELPDRDAARGVFVIGIEVNAGLIGDGSPPRLIEDLCRGSGRPDCWDGTISGCHQRSRDRGGRTHGTRRIGGAVANVNNGPEKLTIEIA